LIRDKSAESAASKIFEDDRVLVFMPLPEEEVAVPGHVLVVPKRLRFAGSELYGGRS
jgi:diadenosine tetraphosphate (Ap4A) HIT family hydrolase